MSYLTNELWNKIAVDVNVKRQLLQPDQLNCRELAKKRTKSFWEIFLGLVKKFDGGSPIELGDKLVVLYVWPFPSAGQQRIVHVTFTMAQLVLQLTSSATKYLLVNIVNSE